MVMMMVDMVMEMAMEMSVMISIDRGVILSIFLGRTYFAVY